MDLFCTRVELGILFGVSVLYKAAEEGMTDNRNAFTAAKDAYNSGTCDYSLELA
jgi:hypothetical protein